MLFDDLIPELQPFARLLFDAAARGGLQPRVTSTRRSRSQQAKLYARFRAGQSPYPALPPGLSAHQFGYAFDMVSLDLADVGYTWQTWGGKWGGKADPVHFEFPGFSPPADDPDVGELAKDCDFVASLSPLGIVQAADTIAEWIAPLTSGPDSLERQVQAFIQGPCSYIARNL